jgi:methylated-DNA-[protein]-cysteine S-methyltransferase
MPALTCDQALDLLDDARAGALPARTSRALAAHLDGCEECRTDFETMDRLNALMGGIDMPTAVSHRLDTATAHHFAEQLRARAFLTPIGWTALAYSDSGLVLIERSDKDASEAIEHLRGRLEDFVVQERPRDDIGESAVRKLIDYHDGHRVRFDEPLDLHLATPFTRDVLAATSRIPYGHVRPYAWVASEIGRPRACRAVGNALHVNPLAPIIPCHRVVASGGGLGGYGGGPEMKRWLLRLEGFLES